MKTTLSEQEMKISREFLLALADALASSFSKEQMTEILLHVLAALNILVFTVDFSQQEVSQKCTEVAWLKAIIEQFYS